MMALIISSLRARCPSRSSLMACFASRAAALSTIAFCVLACVGSYHLGIRQQTSVYDPSKDPLQSILFQSSSSPSSSSSQSTSSSATTDASGPHSHHHGHSNAKLIRRPHTPNKKVPTSHQPPADIRSKLTTSSPSSASSSSSNPSSASSAPVSVYAEPQLLYLAICIISDRRSDSRQVRDAARRTYLYPLYRPNVATKIQHWFVVGVNGASEAETKALQEESEKYGDMLLLPLIDSCAFIFAFYWLIIRPFQFETTILSPSLCLCGFDFCDVYILIHFELYIYLIFHQTAAVACCKSTLPGCSTFSSI